MKRLELYVTENRRIALDVFKTENSKHPSLVLKGRDAYVILKKLKNKTIVDVVEDSSSLELTIHFDKYVLNINEYDRLLNRESLSFIINKLKKYEEKQKISKIRSRKVKRKNKYAGKKIAATGLAVLMLGTCALGISGLDYNENEKTEISTEISDEELALHNELVISIDNNLVSNKELMEENDSVSKIEPEPEEPEILFQQQTTTVSVNYEDRSDTAKANKTQRYYGDMIEKYATIYGVDPALALAVATQERGVHSSEMDSGGATGLMQIQNSVWVGQFVQAYNFKTQKREKFLITSDNIKNLENNIKIGCMILQNAFEYMNYNPLAAVQCYNMGCGNMNKILTQYAKDENKTVEQVLNNIGDNGWLEYRNIVTQGDQEYIEHVLSWMGEDVNIKNVKQDGTLVQMRVNNNFKSKKIY